MSLKGRREPAENVNRRVSASAFDATQVGQIDLGIMRKLLLGKLPLDPQPTHVFADDLAPIHRAHRAGGLRHGLGTISPNSRGMSYENSNDDRVRRYGRQRRKSD